MARAGSIQTRVLTAQPSRSYPSGSIAPRATIARPMTTANPSSFRSHDFMRNLSHLAGDGFYLSVHGQVYSAIADLRGSKRGLAAKMLSNVADNDGRSPRRGGKVGRQSEKK